MMHTVVPPEIREKVAALVWRIRPRHSEGLRAYIKYVLGVDLPSRGTCPGHDSPMDYLSHVFFEQRGDPIVWANRGGGKTFVGALATLLDMIFKPGIQIRILGGSGQQSMRMHEHLCRLAQRPYICSLIDGNITNTHLRFKNGSGVELLTQSQTSVRGHHVQKLRCDEIDEFEPDVWRAAQFVTQSAMCGGKRVRGSIEALSTMHRPFGPMHDLVTKAEQDGEKSGWRVFKWCAMDVIGECTLPHACEDCGLFETCGGRARTARGFQEPADILAQQKRSSIDAFESEMLCLRPSLDCAVYRRFDPSVHVREVPMNTSLRWIGGVDFGSRSPFVMLWAQLRPLGDGRVRVEVIDEYSMEGGIIGEHLRAMAGRRWPRPAWIGADPAGNAANSQTRLSDVDVMRKDGYVIRTPRAKVNVGVEAVRRRLAPAWERSNVFEEEGCDAANSAGDAAEGRKARLPDPLLLIHPRCRTLIHSMSCYKFNAKHAHRDDPLKDGNDHAVDALRYMIVALDAYEGQEMDYRSY